MQAFPKDSLNNSLGGAGPLNSTADHSAFMGNATDEAFRDYARGGKGANAMYSSSRAEPPIFNPVGQDIIHGDESHGLGTSTFLEGTPAARSAIVRRQVEQAQENMEGGLQRKKSLAQRIRRVGGGPRDNGGRSGGEGGYSRISPEAVGSGASNLSDNNPFFSEYNKGEEGFSTKGRDDARSPPNQAPTNRRPSAGLILERRSTTDGTSALDDSAPPKPTGLLAARPAPALHADPAGQRRCRGCGRGVPPPSRCRRWRCCAGGGREHRLGRRGAAGRHGRVGRPQGRAAGSRAEMDGGGCRGGEGQGSLPGEGEGGWREYKLALSLHSQHSLSIASSPNRTPFLIVSHVSQPSPRRKQKEPKHVTPSHSPISQVRGPEVAKPLCLT
ncbi:uncharacterized protein AUP68_05807 [Ilyonectria robusta]